MNPPQPVDRRTTPPDDRPAHPRDAGRRAGWGRFALHYLEMVVAMLVGMAVLGGALRVVLAAAGVEYSMQRFPVLTIVEMALTMGVGMAAWMRFRGHGRAGTPEMSAAMLVPAAVVLVPVWLGVPGAGPAMAVEHVAMFVLMFLVMLRRREEYAAAHDPGKPTAAVVVGNRGANVSDALAPYDVLATTGAFNVYTVAPQRRPLPLLGGLDLVPDLDFAQLRERLGGAAPDVTVVPEMPESDGDAAVTAWLRDTASDGLVLSVCTGARLVADAGLLGGRDATSHWYRLDGLEQRHPEVNWQRGTRYVDDGDVITTGGLLWTSRPRAGRARSSNTPPPAPGSTGPCGRGRPSCASCCSAQQASPSRWSSNGWCAGGGPTAPDGGRATPEPGPSGHHDVP